MVLVKVSSNEREAVRDAISKEIPGAVFGRVEDGDVEIHHDDKLCYVIERKSQEDLRASFGNGHLKDQLARLHLVRQTHPTVSIVLIVEWRSKADAWDGRPAFRSRITDKALSCCLTKLQLTDRITVCFTRSLKDTALCIKWFSERCAKGDHVKDATVTGNATTSLGDREPIAKTPRLRHGSKEDVWEAMLCCIPAISKTRSKTILRHFNGDVIKALDSLKHAEPKALAKQLKGIGTKSLEGAKRCMAYEHAS